MRPLLLLLPLALLACSDDDGGGTSGAGGSAPTLTDAQYRDKAIADMHEALLADVEAMGAAAKDLQAAAPTPPDRGWDPTLDAAEMTKMRDAWVRARTAYEHIEGALAPLFPNVDTAIDARYDDFLTDLEAQGGDTDLFDGKGVTGMHAIERILYSDVTPAHVVDFEKSLAGYVPAAFPATAAEAAEFKEGLAGQFIVDAAQLEKLWTPANIDVAVAFQGLISLVNEQLEKVVKAASDEEESRYSQHTMADLRDNLAGSKTVYALFQPWILSKSSATDPSHDGKTIDAKIAHGFGLLDAAYATVSGDAIPQPPETWSAEDPSPADLMTPFGKLYSAVQGAVTPTQPDSIVSQMNDAASMLGFPAFPGGK